MEQLQVLRNELTAPKLQSLTDDEQYDSLIDVWSEVKLLTGAVLHTDKMLELQMEVIRRFLATSRQFSGLTPSEIRHAFYLNAQGELEKSYRHYNKELNAEFIGDVLLAYLNYKRTLYLTAGTAIKALIDPPLNEVKTAVIIPDDHWRQYIQQDYQLYKANKRDWIFGIPVKYAYLRRVGLIGLRSREHWQGLYKRAMAKRMQYGNTIPKPGENRDAIIEARRIYQTWQDKGWIPMEEHHRIVLTIRQGAYLRFFWYLAGCGINDIFSEIEIPDRPKRINHVQL